MHALSDSAARRYLLGVLAAACWTASPAVAQSTVPARSVYLPLSPAAAGTQIRVAPVSPELRRDYELPAFYTRCVVIRGVPIIGSNNPSEYAFLEAAYSLDHMLADCPKQVTDALLKSKVRLGIIGVVEYTMDIPENQTEENLSPKEAAYQDRRSRGLGGLPLATCAEENVLNLPSDPYRTEAIGLHEFAHTLLSAIQIADPSFYQRVEAAYRRAMAAGRFAKSYAAVNEQEYWAEGVQDWFDCNNPTNDNRIHNGIWRRDQVKAYDPELSSLLAEAFGDGEWRYTRSDGRTPKGANGASTRPAAEMAHLAGLDRATLPAFDFNKSPRVAATRPATLPR